MSDSYTKTMVEELAGVSLDVGSANELLTSSIIKYLSDKGLIDLGDYLLFNTETQQKISQNIDNEREKRILNMVFENHRKNFEKSE